ncbi:hypothetical protein Tco_1135013 [Tanacetum coccineum]
MGSNEEIRRLAQEAEKQQLFAQKVQQQNTTLTSQLELYKERNRILEGINKDNNYLNEFFEADEQAKCYNKQAQSQLVRDRDIIRDLEKQRDKLELDVKDYKKQKEEYQKTQTIFNQTQCNKEKKYLDDILQLQAKIKDFENVVCKMGKPTKTLRLLTNEQKAFRDNLRKSGLGYNGPYVLSQAYAKIPKFYNAYELCNKSEELHVFDYEETLEDAFKRIRIYMMKLTRISKESKDVSNESKTADTVCNDAFGVTQELSKRIVELEKDLSKFEAKSIAFEIALQHKSRENNSLKTVQKENENFMASLQLENAHLKQTYKDLFESVQRSKVETNQCDEVKVKDNFDEIETKNIELEYRVASLIKENEHLKLTYKNLFDSIKKSRVQTKTSNVTQNEAENLKSQLFEFAETKFSNILEKIEFFKKSPGEKQHLFENKTSVFQIKIDELEKVLTQQTKDFNAVKLELSNRTAKFEAYFEKLEKTKVVLERQLARKVDDSKAEKDQFLKEINHLRTQLENLKGKSVKTKFDKHSILGKPPADKLLINSQISKSWFTPKVDMQKSLSKPVTAQSLPKNEKDQLLKRIAYLESKLASQDIRSCQKEYHELRTLYNALKVKFDSLNRKRRETNVSKSSKPRESVSAKVHTGESSKPFSRRVSQFTTYSLQKDRKFSKNSQSFETLTPQKGFKKRASNAKHQSFETTYSCFTPVKQVWRPIKESQTFEASTSQKSFKTRTLKGKNQVFDPHSRFTPVKQAWRPKQSHSKSFKYSKSEMLSMQNKNDSASIINKKGRFSNEAKTNFRNVSSNDNHKWTSSLSTRFKTPHETPSFKNQWKIKRNFKSPLIPRALFSNETPISSSRWNSTSLHRLDTTFNWFSKFGKPVSTVLKWVPKLAFKLQVEEEEEERLAKEKAQREEEANIVSWDNVQAMIDADYQMAQQMQAEEQEKLSIEEKSKLFVQLLEARKKHFAIIRAQEMRNEQPTKAQKRNTMSTYPKNMAGYKHNQLKNKSFNDIQKLFDKAMKRVNTFVDMDIELVENSKVRAEGSDTRTEGSSKRAGEDLQQESMKKFDREDLETLYKLVKAKYGSTRPVEDLDLVIYGDLKIMFDPYVEDQVWKNQSDYRVLDWKLYDSCGVHSLRKQNLSMKKLEILKENIKFRGGLLGLKDFMMIFELLLLRYRQSFKASKVLDYLSRTVESYTDVAEVILKDIDNDDDYREFGSMMDLVLGRKAYVITKPLLFGLQLK